MMDREALRATLVTLLEEEMGESYDLADDASDLREGLGLDSVDVVGLVMRVERQFRIRLAMEELMEVRQLGQLLDLIQGKLAAKDGNSSKHDGLQSTAA
jgi:acyl carrier protein